MVGSRDFFLVMELGWDLGYFGFSLGWGWGLGGLGL